ncbi:hypothetical protein OQA88_8190 [Cercophora sp. LCS_1]
MPDCVALEPRPDPPPSKADPPPKVEPSKPPASEPDAPTASPPDEAPTASSKLPKSDLLEPDAPKSDPISRLPDGPQTLPPLNVVPIKSPEDVDSPDSDPTKPDVPRIDPSKAIDPLVPSNRPSSIIEPPLPSSLLPQPTGQPDGPDTANPIPIPPATGPEGDGPTTRPQDNSRDASSSSATASACKLRPKRGQADGLVQARLGEDMVSQENCHTVHVTKTKGPMKCPRKYSQACCHYRSVMRVHTQNRNMVRWTCHETKNTGDRKKKRGKGHGSMGLHGGLGTGRKRATLVGVGKWLRPRTTLPPNANGNRATKGCDRDEWPPAAFWPGDEEAAKQNPPMVQRIQFLPWHENEGAGQVWKSFCVVHNAQTVKNKATFVNNKYVKTVGKPAVTMDRGRDGTTTVITTVSVDTAHAIFTFKDWDRLPEDPDFDGLKENECWPRQLARENPGWALLREVEFYGPPLLPGGKLAPGQHPELLLYVDD